MTPNGTHKNGALARRPSAATLGTLADRLPPQNIEAEQGVLGGILLDNETLHDVAPILKPDDFWRDTHQVIYRRILALHAESRPVDPLSLVEALEQHGEFDRIGGHDALSEILGRGFVAANAAYYAEIVKAKSLLRTVIAAANQMLRDAYADRLTAQDIVREAERLIFDLSSQQSGGRVRPLADSLTDAMDSVQRRIAGEIAGITSGFPDLDWIVGGFRKGHLVIVAARPAMGKSAIAWGISEHAAREGNRVLYVSLEMPDVGLAERALAAESRVDGNKLRVGYALSGPDLERLGRADHVLRQLPIYVDDTPTQSMLQVLSTARKLQLRQGLDLIVVDYLQLIAPDDPSRSTQEQVSMISRRLKALAREIDVPVIALSQLNRKVEERPDKQPHLADLRDSGAIEQDADIVILMHRPDYYDPNDQPGVAIVNVAKNRWGATGGVKLTFLRHLTRFESLAAREAPIDADMEF